MRRYGLEGEALNVRSVRGWRSHSLMVGVGCFVLAAGSYSYQVEAHRRESASAIDGYASLKTPSGRTEFVDTYCLGCHDEIQGRGGLVLEGVATDSLADDADIWEQVAKRLSTSEMPPLDEELRPDPAMAQAFASSLIADLDSAAQSAPFAGRTVIRRLNRTEYANAVRDLLRIDFPYLSELPRDGGADGFDNIADALSFSPVLLESYMKVARKVSYLALGESDPAPVTERYPATKSQSSWQEGMPFGTRGGVLIKKYFPRSGEYDLRAFLNPVDLTAVEGVRFFQTRVRVNEGVHTFIATFPQTNALHEGPVPNLAGPGGMPTGGPLDALGSAVRPKVTFFLDGKKVNEFEIRGPSAGEAAGTAIAGPPTLARAEITGPHNPGPASQTESRRHILTCEPGNRAGELPCAEKILSQLLRRAWRRDVTSQDVQPYLTSFTRARTQESFHASVAASVRDILVSPEFLFRLEFDPADAKPGALYPLSDFALASRLSFFLWSSIPDDVLLNVAAKGELRKPDVLEGEVARMLADAKASALIDNFAAQWLGVRNGPHPLEGFTPDTFAYPEFDRELGDAFETEFRLFMRSIMRENRSIMDVVTADYSFLNERLATNYGIPNIKGPGFRRVTFPENSARGGVLGMGAVLMPNSHTNSTSPVYRGEWVLTSLFNSPPKPPPNGVPPLSDSAVAGKPMTLRQQTERHRADPACASCHVGMDPYGFSLENFDVIGRWRDADAGGAIDATASLPNGKSFVGPQGLRKMIGDYAPVYVTAATARMMTYALGRRLEGRDMPTVRAIVKSTAPDHRFSDLVMGVVRSTPFLMKQAEEDPS